MTTTSEFQCFAVEALARGQRVLLRYQGLYRGYDCHPKQRHEANVVHDEVDLPLDEHHRVLPMTTILGGAWPERCTGAACPHEGGYVFKPDDLGNVMVHRLGLRADTGETVRYYEPPVGGVFDITPHIMHRGPDNRALCIMTPDGLWYVDAPHVTLDAKWTREGEPATMTVTQTKGVPYRWTLTNGILRAAPEAP